MSLWWEVPCHSVGLSAAARRIDGGFNTKWIDPVGTPGGTTTSWDFHHIGWHNNVFDPSVKINLTSPRVPQNEDIDSPYKTDLYESGTWSPLAAFALGQTDPKWSLISEVD